MKALILALCLLSTAAACPNNPTNPVTGDVLCAHLSDIGCAQPSGCASAYDTIGPLTTINAACLMSATNKTSAARCGVKCN